MNLLPNLVFLCEESLCYITMISITHTLVTSYVSDENHVCELLKYFVLNATLEAMVVFLGESRKPMSV